METNVFDQLPLLLAVPRAAAILGVSRAAAYRLAASGELPVRRLGGRVYVVTAELRELVASWKDRPVAMAPIIGNRPVATNRLDFVRPGSVAGQISAVSVVVGKMHTRLRGRLWRHVRQRYRSQDPRRITPWEHPLVYGVRAIRTANDPQFVELRIDSVEHDVPLTPDDLRKLARYLDRLAYPAAEKPGAA